MAMKQAFKTMPDVFYLICTFIHVVCDKRAIGIKVLVSHTK